jgi:hypothetical protein
MNELDFENMLLGTVLIDILTGEELKYYRHTNSQVVCTDENKLTIWLPFDRIKIKEKK